MSCAQKATFNADEKILYDALWGPSLLEAAALPLIEFLKMLSSIGSSCDTSKALVALTHHLSTTAQVAPSMFELL